MGYTLNEQKQHRAQFVAALRSQDYNQTFGKLHDDTGYCCLGVACEVSHIAGWTRPASVETYYQYGGLEWNHIEHLKGLGGTRYCFGTMPEIVMDYYGFQHAAGWSGGWAQSLVNLNDTRTSFKEIADYIESEPKGMFVED